MIGQNKKKSIVEPDLSPPPQKIKGGIDHTFLQKVQAQFVQALRISFSKQMGKVCQIRIISETYLTYEELIQMTPFSSLIGVLGQRGPLSFTLAIIDSNFSNGAIETVLESERKKDQKNKIKKDFAFEDDFRSLERERDFSQKELSILKKVFELIAAEFSGAWKEIYPLDLKLIRVEQNPQWVNISFDLEKMLVIQLSLEGEELGGSLTLVLPCSGIELIKNKII